jgi:hypothetical protein
MPIVSQYRHAGLVGLRPCASESAGSPGEEGWLPSVLIPAFLICRLFDLRLIDFASSCFIACSRARLQTSNALGIPNLWIPKRVIRVEAIPVLASGKPTHQEPLPKKCLAMRSG